jgi:hypothetical protein
MFGNVFCQAQQKLPIVKANSKNAVFIHENNEKSNWGIDPTIKIDAHNISKITKPTWITFKTDVDQIKVKIKPGEKFDFIVLLNGKDSCRTRIESLPVKNYANQKPEIHDTIPFVLTEFNNIKVQATLNGIDTLDLKFDSGTTGLLLTNDALKNKTHIKNPEPKQNMLKIGKQIWTNLEVFPVQLSGQGTDGRFGWDLFDGKIVEINYDKKLFIVNSKLAKPTKKYSKFKIEYTNTLFCINGSIKAKGKKYNNRFLFDTGYQRTIMLDSTILQEQKFPKDLKIIKKVIMKNGQGKEIPVVTVNNEQFNLANQVLKNIPAQLLTTNNPARFKTHILGNEVLKRFNTILDLQKNVVYLKPNTLFFLPYAEAAVKP